MRLLVDSALPDACDGVLRDGVELTRYHGEEVSDAALARHASATGCEGVVFLGRRILGQRGLLELVEEADLLCVVVNEDEPNRAGEHLLANLGLIPKHAQESRVLIVLAREIQVAPPEAVSL